jgi:AcrR family transcriptional regulator
MPYIQPALGVAHIRRTNDEEVRRCRGRPQIRSDDETLRLIIEAAVEFQANGYAVAQRAGISTKTPYRLVPTKAELLRSVVSDRVESFVLAIDEELVGALDLNSALERILVTYGRLTFNDEVIAINRLVLGECDRFPEIAQAFYEAAIRRTSEAMSDWLERQCRRGLIALDDPLPPAGMPREDRFISFRSAPSAASI